MLLLSLVFAAIPPQKTAVPSQSIPKLEKFVFQSDAHYSKRWKAFSKLMKQNPKPDYLQHALNSQEWFLRDLALKHAKDLYPQKAIYWSRDALQDPSLIVRTTAVKNLLYLKPSETTDIYWMELKSPKNFRGSQSLWSRKYLAKALYELQDWDKQNIKEWQPRFVSWLKDTDPQVQAYAVLTMRKIFGEKKNPVQNKALAAKLWQEYLKKPL